MKKHCIACGYHITHPVYHPEKTPLCALHLPQSREEAREVLRFPLEFNACANCGHIFNTEFEYYRVPYEHNSNLMYNEGLLWKQHMSRLIDILVDQYDCRGKTLLDIGCGDGGFLKLLIERNLDNRCIGFEPGIEALNARKNGLEVYQDYFVPEKSLRQIRPDFLICRHVIEHLDQPKDFVSDIVYWCNRYEIYPVFLAEVPRIDKAIENARVNDYLYEHVSNFTQFSFTHMLEISGYEILSVEAAYGDEVTVAFVRPRQLPRFHTIHQSAGHYRRTIASKKQSVQRDLEQLLHERKRVAFWGGTGKGASFLNAFDVLEEKFPVVVDSDYHKVGRFVPRTAQKIQPPEFLTDHPVDVIVITTQWRAKDIYQEIQRRAIPYENVLVLANGKLEAYHGQDI